MRAFVRQGFAVASPAGLLAFLGTERPGSLGSLAMARNRVGLLAALAVDNFGSGLFLPMALLYVTRVVGLPLAVAGTVVAAGTMAGLAVPAVAGRLVDSVGALWVVVGAEVVQLSGAVAYLAARGVAVVAVAAVLLALREVHTRPWLPGAALALCAAVTGMGGTVALRATRGLRRTTVMVFAAGLYVVSSVACVAALVIAPGWRSAELLVAAGVFALAGLLFQRANALAEAMAPAAVKGRYLAAFQYAFTVAGIIAPAVVALFSVAAWLPWLLVAASGIVAVVVFRWLAGRLPEAALRPVPTLPQARGLLRS